MVTFFRYTNTVTGRVIQVQAETPSGGIARLQSAIRDGIDAKNDGQEVKKMWTVISDDGKWVEESHRMCDLHYAATGRRMTVKSIKYTPTSRSADEHYDAPNPFPGLRGF